MENFAMRMKADPFRAFAVALLCCSLPAVARAADQPQWGQQYTRNMVSDEKNLPDTFDVATGQNIKWAVKLGNQTFSTPIVAGGKVFIGTNNDRPRDETHKGDRGVMMCLDEKTGDLLWQLVVPKFSNDPYWDWTGTGICSPPTVEANRVYLVTNRGEVVCMDINGLAGENHGPFLDEANHMAPNGKPAEPTTKTDADILWLFDIVHQAGIRQHDAACASILIHGQFLYLNTSNGVDNTHRKIACPDAPGLIVVDKTTGKYVARDEERTAPNTIHCTWSSPSLGEVNGKPVIFFGGGDGICYAFEAVTEAPADGKPAKLKCLWKFDVDPNGPKQDIFKWQDNFKEGPSNITAMPVYQDGRVYVTGGGDLWHGKPIAWLKCLDAAKGTEIWTYTMNGYCTSTVAIRDGLLFVGDASKKLHCVDARTGQPYWVQQTRGQIWGSPLVADGKVYIGTRGKDFWILAADKHKKVLGQVDLDSPVSATATAANGTIYIATMKMLYAVQKK